MLQNLRNELSKNRWSYVSYAVAALLVWAGSFDSNPQTADLPLYAAFAAVAWGLTEHLISSVGE